MENKIIEFYFDFMSPYAYLAHERLISLAENSGYSISYKPIDLTAAKIAAGNSGPPNRHIPPKIKYLNQDLKRWASRYRIPLKSPPSHESEKLNKGALLAIDENVASEYCRCVWRATWGEGGDFLSPQLIEDVAREMSWDPLKFSRALETDALQQRFYEVNRSAQSRGVFGVPTFIIGDKMWWGNDRLDFVEEYILKSKR